MNPAPSGPYARIRLLSLDVAVGALGGGLMAAGVVGQRMPVGWMVLLPLAVWVVYTGDHLLDARRLGERASTPRHRFHHAHFRPLAVLALLGGALCAALAFPLLGATGLGFGVAMGAFAGVHLLLVRLAGGRTSPFLIKEAGVALVYTLGIWGMPLLMSGHVPDGATLLIVGQFLLLALVNLLEFSYYEHDIDAADDQTSWARALGKARSIRVIRGVLALTTAVGFYTVARHGGLFPVSARAATGSQPGVILRAEMVLGAMTLLLSALTVRRDWFAQHERYRAWGDGAFLLPFLFPLLALR